MHETDTGITLCFQSCSWKNLERAATMFEIVPLADGLGFRISHLSACLPGKSLGIRAESAGCSMLHETVRPDFPLGTDSSGPACSSTDKTCSGHVPHPENFSETAKEACLLHERTATACKSRMGPYPGHAPPELDGKDTPACKKRRVKPRGHWLSEQGFHAGDIPWKHCQRGCRVR